jgi:mono/diheme cytochrome c family protein
MSKSDERTAKYQSAAEPAHSEEASHFNGASWYAVSPWSAATCRRFGILLFLSLLVVSSGCRQDMQDQPKMKPFRGTTFYADGLSARQPIQGTVARGFLREDSEFFTGKRSRTTASPGTQAIAGQQTQPQQQGQQQSAVPGQQNSFPDDIDYFPIPITEDVVKRGRERYDIFCSACHGLTGNGDGMIVRRGFRRAASFNDDRLRQAPVGHFFDAITNGWGAMPAYASQVAVQDRWAIVAYIRALQESQRNLTTPAASPSPTPAAGGRQ